MLAPAKMTELARRAPPAPSHTAAIRLDNVSKRFQAGGQSILALDGIGLEIRDKEFVAVVGPSGCGKSTLIRLIAGLNVPSSGSVEVGGTPVTKPCSDMGIVFQKPNLVDWRTVLGNVLLQTDLRRLRGPQWRERARSLIAAVGLSEFENRHPFELSGGMQQRAAIARALLHEPQTLLMDEPFGALDALTREQLRIDVEQLWSRRGMTVVRITHSIDEAVLLADRVVVMSPRPGRIEHVFDVPLARPRGLHAKLDPVFMRLVDDITAIFLARGVLKDSAPLN